MEHEPLYETVEEERVEREGGGGDVVGGQLKRPNLLQRETEI